MRTKSGKSIIIAAGLALSVGPAVSEGAIGPRGSESFSPQGADEVEKLRLDEARRPQIVPDQVLPSGHRRVFQTLCHAITPAELEQARLLGKTVELDPQTGERMIETFTDYLPENWGAGAVAGNRVDSYGNPIVNEVDGLPGWAQRDVDALQAAIVTRREQRAQAAIGQDTTEIAGVLGNFVGQAIVRGIAFQDLLSLDDTTMIDAAAADAIIGYLHFYENLKFINADDGRYTYAPTAYPVWVRDFVSARGASLDEVLAIEPPPEDSTRGGQPSGCYTRTEVTRGMTYLTGQTDIWRANDADDASADIATGFPMFFFFGCEDMDNNDMVRVSTNGYISFFQQGGGALRGFEYENTPIPSAVDPDGYVAQWWDDLFVASDQGYEDSVSYKTEGAIRERVFTIEWDSVSRYGGYNFDFHTFQVKLFEGTDVVQLCFGGADDDWADNATMGIENFAGNGGDCGTDCSNANRFPPHFNFRYTPSPRPANNACGTASNVLAGTSLTGDLHHATSDGDGTCGESEHNRDVWYTFLAHCTGTLSVNTCGSRNINGLDTGIDSVLSVHAGCPGSEANQLACNDDFAGAGCSALDSAVALSMNAGQRVYIRVTHFGGAATRFASGAFRLNVDFVATSNPSNDNCSAALNLTAGTTRVGNLRCATSDGAAGCGGSAGNPDIWYQFTAPALGTLDLDTCGTRNGGGPDTVLSVYSGCPGNAGNELACNDDGLVPGCHALDSRVSVGLVPGQNVKIRVSHYGDDEFRMGNGQTLLTANFGCGGDCAGDLDHNCAVSLQDLSILLANFGTASGATPDQGDVDGNGAVELQDLSMLLANFGTTCR